MNLTSEQRLSLIAQKSFELGTIIMEVRQLDSEHAADMLSTAIFSLIRPLTTNDLLAMRSAVVPCDVKGCTCHLAGKSAMEAVLLLKPLSDDLIGVEVSIQPLN